MVQSYQVTELITPGFGGDVLAVNHLVIPCGATSANAGPDPLYYATFWFSISPLLGPVLILPVPITPGSLGTNDAFFEINDAGDVVGSSAQDDPDVFPLGQDSYYTGARASQGKG
jgi:hypothetical protein